MQFKSRSSTERERAREGGVQQGLSRVGERVDHHIFFYHSILEIVNLTKHSQRERDPVLSDHTHSVR